MHAGCWPHSQSHISSNLPKTSSCVCETFSNVELVAASKKQCLCLVVVVVRLAIADSVQEMYIASLIPGHV